MLKVTYRLRAMKGEIRFWDLNTVESTIRDPTLEQCITDAIANAAWHDEAMPDWEEADEELVVRLGGLRKHLDEDQERVEDAPAPLLQEQRAESEMQAGAEEGDRLGE
jgi:hypothetical protein